MRSQSMLIGAGSKNPDKRVSCYAMAGSSLKGCCGLIASRKKLSLLIYALFPAFPGHVSQYLFFIPRPRFDGVRRSACRAICHPEPCQDNNRIIQNSSGEGEGSALLLSRSMQYCDPPDLRSRFLGLTINFGEPTGRNKEARLRNGMPLSWRFSYARQVSGHEFTRAEKIPSRICLLSEAPPCTTMPNQGVLKKI
jgi:hypothetical protein